MKRKSGFVFSLVIACSLFLSCESSDDEDLVGNWTKSSDFEGVARNEAVSFVVGDFAYVGTGYNGKKQLSDFWKYDSDNKYWTQVADFPGKARYSAVAFGVETKGYVGTGYDGDNYLKDFWEYDPATNIWTEKAEFGGSARYGAAGFGIDSKGYIGTGYDDNYLKDLWEYDPTTDAWTQKVSLGGSKRREASVFVISGKAYMCAGINNGSLVTDFWQYDPQSGAWTELRKITNYSDDSYDDEYTTITRSNAVGFALNGKGYLALGSSSSLVSAVWEYNPVSDIWEQKSAFEGTTRDGAVSFVIKDRSFITTGRSGGYQLDDTWEFKPDETYDDKN
ncbi:MAG: galactose oxidase [Bacteroidetes bacterium]|nr:galactose oxidase [Bacteroidales bacterium]NJO70052.1 galactose oxidase [Bacteroidota bacterium]